MKNEMTGKYHMKKTQGNDIRKEGTSLQLV